MITELILKLKNSGKTLIVSSHIFSSLTDISDEIFLLKNGQIGKSFNKEKYELLEAEMKKNSYTKKLSDLDF